MAALPWHSILLSLVSGILPGIGIPFPGFLVLVAAAATVPTLLAATLLSIIFAAGYVAGSALQYYLGMAFAPRLQRLLPPSVWQKTCQILERHGEPAVLWTRPFGVGNYISIPAGMVRMPMARFLIYTFVGIWPYSFLMVLAGTYLAAVYAKLLQWLLYLILVLIILGVLAALGWLWARMRDTKTSRP